MSTAVHHDDRRGLVRQLLRRCPLALGHGSLGDVDRNGRGGEICQSPQPVGGVPANGAPVEFNIVVGVAFR